MLHESRQILFNHSVGEGYYTIGFSCEKMAAEAEPGQFLMLRMVDEAWEGKLSRPFSISNVKDDIIEIVFETVGKSTNNLAGADKGRLLDVIGPLGNGFSIEKEADVHVLIAGGIGIAPFPYLSTRILQECPKSKVLVLLGVRSVSRLLMTGFFEEYDIELKISSDDGSVGLHGQVTGLFENVLETLGESSIAAYACGPGPMLKEVASATIARGIPCRLSVEEIMACGVGACLGCACKVREGDGWTYKMVCKDGPVFDAKEVIFDEN